MGGYRSGRPRTVNRGTVEDELRLDMPYLRCNWFAIAGCPRSATLYWTRQGVRVASTPLASSWISPIRRAG